MMKRTIFFLCGLLMVMNLSATDTIRLNMQAFMEDYPLDADGKWVETLNGGTTQLDFESFSFSHLINGKSQTDNSRHWDGFTFCTSGDNNNYGSSFSSELWIDHQWGCMAGGGIDSTGAVKKGAPYLVAYWSNLGELPSLSMTFSDGDSHRPLGIWVCNHPWAYYGVLQGDGFAHPFSSEDDYFTLTAHGMDADGREVGQPVTFTLASFEDGVTMVSEQWQWMDLRTLGQVHGVYFTMASSDNSGDLGMNTAAFFCLGGAEALEHIDELERPSGLQTKGLDENRLELKWETDRFAAYYRVFLEGELIDSTETNSYIFTGLNAYTEYAVQVQGVSALGESSDFAYATGRTLDCTAPSAPANLRVQTDDHSAILTWDEASDNVGITRYVIYVNGTREARPKKTTYTVTGLGKGETYRFEVEAMDASGNVSERVAVTATTGITTDNPSISDGWNSSASKTMIQGTVYVQKNGQSYTLNGQKTTN